KKEEMKDKKFNLREWMFGKPEPTPQKFAEVTTTDGLVLSYEGELASGTPIFLVVEDGEPVPAEAGAYLVEMDGEGMTINVDENGIITSVDAVEEDMSEEEMAAQVVTSGALKELFEAYTETIDAKLKAATDIIEANAVTMADQKKQISHMVEFQQNKHNYVALKSADTDKPKGGYRRIIENQKVKNK
ncbi:MAG: hypothetical protein GQ553_03095, partial [Nitrosomonadaceae bacterium]|nr:hypothetical protein [Nitrosomonadaceae bacterium]